MYFFIFLLVYVLVFGDTTFINKITSEAVGFIIDNWGTQTMLMNAMSPDDKWFAEWSVQYWTAFIVYAPIIGMFLAIQTTHLTGIFLVLLGGIIGDIFFHYGEFVEVAKVKKCLRTSSV